MTPADDNWHAMTPFPSQLRGSRERDLDVVGAGGRPLGQDLQPVAAFLSQLRGLGELPAPRPSDELATLLSQGFAAEEAPRAARPADRPAGAGWLRRGALAVGLSAGLSASLVGAAAASDRLPAGAQDVLARFVETVTPFDVRADRPQAPPANEELGQHPTTVEELEVPPATPATATSQEEPGGGASAGTGSEAEDSSARGHEEDSDRHRSGDSDRQSADDADGDDRSDGDGGGDRSADVGDESGSAGDDDGGADHALSGDHSDGSGSTGDAGPAVDAGSGSSEGSGGDGSGDSAGFVAEPEQGD